LGYNCALVLFKGILIISVTRILINLDSLSFQFKKLQVLEMSDLKNLDEEMMVKVAMRLQTVVSLSVSLNNAITDRVVEAIARYMPKLIKLNLVNCKITDQGRHRLPSLKALHIGQHAESNPLLLCFGTNALTIGPVESTLYVLR
jgi:hypothetical protein